MIVFLIDKITPRWEYTFDFIFGIRGIEYQIITDDSALIEFDHVFKIPSHQGGLLRNSAIVSEIDDTDLLSQLFFVLTRMEEYNPKVLDHHQRFSAKQSWQFKNDCLHQCICDRWAINYIESIERELGTSFTKKNTDVEVIPTFDIDNAFAYKYKTGKRVLLSMIKSALKSDSEKILERKEVLSSSKTDPYDGYDLIRKAGKRFKVRLFWQVGDYGGKDFNISLKKTEIKELVQNLSQSIQVGVHPSYSSNSDKKLLVKEIQGLRNVLGKSVDISRQHFLKLRFPETYRNLLEIGIKEDYTMGFADEVGYRNGTANPYSWYDLEKNEITQLVIYPFAYMDGTLNEYLKLSIGQAKEKIKELYLEAQQYGGQFSFIWHNETITDYKIWQGWSSVLEYTLTLKNN